MRRSRSCAAPYDGSNQQVLRVRRHAFLSLVLRFGSPALHYGCHARVRRGHGWLFSGSRSIWCISGYDIAGLEVRAGPALRPGNHPDSRIIGIMRFWVRMPAASDGDCRLSAWLPFHTMQTAPRNHGHGARLPPAAAFPQSSLAKNRGIPRIRAVGTILVTTPVLGYLSTRCESPRGITGMEAVSPAACLAREPNTPRTARCQGFSSEVTPIPRAIPRLPSHTMHSGPRHPRRGRPEPPVSSQPRGWRSVVQCG